MWFAASFKDKVARWKALSGLFYLISSKPFSRNPYSSNPYVCQTLLNKCDTQSAQKQKKKANKLRPNELIDQKPLVIIEVKIFCNIYYLYIVEYPCLFIHACLFVCFSPKMLIHDVHVSRKGIYRIIESQNKD